MGRNGVDCGNRGLLGTGVSKGFEGEGWRKKHFFTTEIPFWGGVILFQGHFLELWKISVFLYMFLVMSWLCFLWYIKKMTRYSKNVS